eukprot:COSAG04_NODE_8968_length_911_cov_1.142857_1_plen_51_part_00
MRTYMLTLDVSITDSPFTSLMKIRRESVIVSLSMLSAVAKRGALVAGVVY